jgi:hypothetical protein
MSKGKKGVAGRIFERCHCEEVAAATDAAISDVSRG